MVAFMPEQSPPLVSIPIFFISPPIVDNLLIPLFFLEPFHPLFYRLLIPVPGGVVKFPSLQLVRKVPLGDITLFEVMGIPVSLMIAELFHQACRGIPDMERHRQGPAFA